MTQREREKLIRKTVLEVYIQNISTPTPQINLIMSNKLNELLDRSNHWEGDTMWGNFSIKNTLRIASQVLEEMVDDGTTDQISKTLDKLLKSLVEAIISLPDEIVLEVNCNVPVVLERGSFSADHWSEIWGYVENNPENCLTSIRELINQDVPVVDFMLRDVLDQGELRGMMVDDVKTRIG